MSHRANATTQAERLDGLNAEARERKWPYIRPVDAATLIILDRSGEEPRVLMGKRSDKLKFMPGMFVFPGGRSEKTDTATPVAGDIAAPVLAALQARVVRPSANRARRLALAAIRETFEETGIIIGTRSTGTSAPSGPWAEFLATGHLPNLSCLTLLARAITPPRRPRRFDTRFFITDARAIAHRVEGIVSPEAELTELAWLTLAQTSSLPLPAITRAILSDLDIALAAGGPAPETPVSFYFEIRRAFRRELITA